MLMTVSVDSTTQPLLAMLGLPEMLVVLAIVLVLFGASKLPYSARAWERPSATSKDVRGRRGQRGGRRRRS